MCMRFIAALALLLTVDPSGARQPDAAEAADRAVEPPIVIDSESSASDLRSGVTRFSGNVTITRGPMRVNADEGVVRQVDGEMTEIELTGDPTTWADTLEDGTVVTGRADRIHFDIVDNVVTLTGEALLQHEQGRYTGDELVYDLDTESLAGRGTNGNRVRVVIEPDAVDQGRDALDEPADDGDGDAARPADDPADDPAADAAAGPGVEGDTDDDADDGDEPESSDDASGSEDPPAG